MHPSAPQSDPNGTSSPLTRANKPCSPRSSLGISGALSPESVDAKESVDDVEALRAAGCGIGGLYGARPRRMDAVDGGWDETGAGEGELPADGGMCEMEPYALIGGTMGLRSLGLGAG